MFTNIKALPNSLNRGIFKFSTQISIHNQFGVPLIFRQRKNLTFLQKIFEIKSNVTFMH